MCSDGSANFSSVNSRNNIDPLLAPMADNGGPVPTFALLSSSPALNAGGGSCIASDARGIPRPQGPSCDIGAFEGTYISIHRSSNGLVLETFAPPGDEYSVESGIGGQWYDLLQGVADDTGLVRIPLNPTNPATLFRVRLR